MGIDFKSAENDARKVWKRHGKGIKAAVQNDTKKPLFSFLEGPPTANAPPGLHHLEVRTFKDVICKFKFMQGFSVPRKGGWDCHGLPVEVQVEKALGLNSKKDILSYGQDKFIKKCQTSVFSNIDDWNKSTKELNYWIDLEHPYRTLDDNYVESVWWSLKELHKKGLLYEGYKVVPYCPRCSTPLSTHEVSQGYKEIREKSVYVKFELEDSPGTYLLAWTTTPWTLPGNSALYVKKGATYVKVQDNESKEFYILAKECLGVLNRPYEIVEEISAKSLVGRKYIPLFDYFKDFDPKYYHIDFADFVELEQGTGLVHSAIMYGEVDFDKAKEQGLKTNHIIGGDGKFLDNVPIAKGLFYKKADPIIIDYLKSNNLLYREEMILHSYPHCWRCETPLLYYAIDSWYVAVTKIRDRMVQLNKKINWSPSHIRDGRFGKWLENSRDWALSRLKFWGTPLPIWKSKDGDIIVIGSVKELEELSGKKLKGLHKPEIDKIVIEKDGKKYKRVSDVIDCWYDSGSASFAQFHYPFENKELFEKRFPYDFISEAIDQTRGWFYTLHVLSTALFDKPTYKNVICAGHILDEKGEKMSKSKGNIIVPNEIIDKVGVDAVRLQLCVVDPGNSKRFSESMMKKSVLPFLNVLYNCKTYYMQLDNKVPSKKIEDKWIISKLNRMLEETEQDLEKFELDIALNKIMDFTVNDFSRRYIRLTRGRTDTKKIVEEVLEKISLVLAPYVPYVSESIYQLFHEKESVHLSKWPKSEKKKIDKDLEADFSKIFEVIEEGFRLRDQNHIGLKWPLPKVKISSKEKVNQKLYDLIKSQLNVKEVTEKKSRGELQVEFDLNMTPELESEGYAREITRKVQSYRKKLGLTQSQKIQLYLIVDGKFKDILNKQKEYIRDKTNSKILKIENVTTVKETFKNHIDFKIREESGEIAVVID